MANETMTVNRLPALTWNWLKMNTARLEANAPAVGAATIRCMQALDSAMDRASAMTSLT